jgi:hypothetical protein
MKSGVAYHLGPMGLQEPVHEKARQSKAIADQIAVFGEHNIIKLAPGEMSAPVVDKRPMKVRRNEAKQRAFARKADHTQDALDTADSIDEVDENEEAIA